MKKAKERRYKRTLFVALGGAGAKTLRRLKQKFLETNDGHIPDQVKFLLIDTNATELMNYRDFDSNEKVCIAVREPYQRYQHDKRNGASTHEFIPEKNAYSLLALERGAGQIRSNGHFAVIENQFSQKLMRVFREKADEIADISIDSNGIEKDPKIEVRLVFSIAGGTGSGIFLPISTIIRSSIKHSELIAYIYSATHYEKVVENSAKKSVMQNAYAAICELDYMMHFGMEGYESVPFSFGPEANQKIEPQNRPFDEVYYLDKRTDVSTPDTAEYVYNEIKRMQDNTADILHIASSNIISSHTGTIDNVRQKIQEGQFNVGDKYAWISGIGIAKLLLNKDGISDNKIKEAALAALEVRLGDIYNPDDFIAKIATAFIGSEFCEDHSENDKDAIVKSFVSDKRIKEECEKKVDSIPNDDYSSKDYKYHLDDVILSSEKSEAISKKLRDNLASKIELMLVSLINDACYGDIKSDEGLPKEGLSLSTIIQILDTIKNRFVDSQKKLQDEQLLYNQKREEKDSERKKLYNSSNQQEESFNQDATSEGLWSNIKNIFVHSDKDIKQQQSTPQSDNVSKEIRRIQAEALVNQILAERAENASNLFGEFVTLIIEKRIKAIKEWVQFLESAKGHGKEKVSKPIKNDSSTENTSNIINQQVNFETNLVEIYALDTNRRVFTYENLTEFANDIGKLPEPSDKWGRTLKLVKLNSNTLLEYLRKSIDDMKKEATQGHIEVNRSECKQKIGSLIDLSTPTMQIDKHGYGDRVNSDSFWYIMTSCPEENEGHKEGQEESVGSLLKKLIEEDVLDIKPHLIHVDGWTDQAILYRVNCAIPAYFVEGVCIGEYGGLTLEGCYEEMKKSKRMYTPFSHEFLRQKLEDGISVLKPHEDVDDNVALEHWVNFNLLGLIQFESTKGTSGTYKIISDVLGEVKTKQLSDHQKVFILGNTRVSAFNAFTRYCKTILDENPKVTQPEGYTYKEAVNSLEYNNQEDYNNKFIIPGEKYLDTVFTDDNGNTILMWHGYPITWHELQNHLDMKDPEYQMLKKEVDFLDGRYND